MKINGLNNINPVTDIKNTNSQPAVEKTGVSSLQDRMQVSGNAHMMQKLLQKAKDIPDIREEKVQEIAARIENGQFEIDSSVIARKMLGF